MPENVQASDPFRFQTRMHLTELTGLRASTLGQLLSLLKTVPSSCIYHHTHHFLQQHQYLSPEPPNDFAHWVIEQLNEPELGERLFSVDTVQFSHIHDLRETFVGIIEHYLRSNPIAKLKFARSGEEFYFMKSVSFVIPTPYAAHNLSEFIDIVGKITIDSIYYHMFEARLRLQQKSNDFAAWVEHSVGNQRLAEHLSRLDPYTSTLDDLRQKIIRIAQHYSTH
jgi:hypothetical protein